MLDATGQWNNQKTPQWNPENAVNFHHPDVAESYRQRPDYHRDIIEKVRELSKGGKVLDIGCGLGELTRALAPHVKQVDAIDWSGPMIRKAQELTESHVDNINWIEGKFEDSLHLLDKDYDLILGGESLHWLNWDKVKGPINELLAPTGVIAGVERRINPSNWYESVKEVIVAYSTAKKWEPLNVEEVMANSIGLHIEGMLQRDVNGIKKTLAQWMDYFHSTSTLTRHRLGNKSLDFDNGLSRLLRPKAKEGLVSGTCSYRLFWGRFVEN